MSATTQSSLSTPAIARANRVFRRGILWSAVPGRVMPKPRETTPAIFSRLESSQAYRLFPAIRAMDPIEPEAIVRRFEIGRHCYVAQVDGLVVAYGWVTYGPEYVGEFERELQISPGEAYIWDCATLPDYRRLGLFSGLLAHMTRCLAEEGTQRLWIIGLAAAPGIDRGVAAAGFQPIFDLTYLRLATLYALRCTPAPDLTTEEIAAAIRLLKADQERGFGPWQFARLKPHTIPNTHFDG